MEDNHQKIREIFLSANEILPPAAREAFLDAACAGEPELRRKVSDMLAMQSQAANFFGMAEISRTQPCAPPRPDPGRDESEGPGSLIGRYRLLEKIGEGGFGVVYMADQVEPLKRRVALKIIKLGMDTREVIARFDAERQALALMDHPNVARVLDAGATGSGRPFFVMELVKGLPITDFCDRECLTPRERIELFISVCQAAQHAHSKGIIHRDLKPSNILVTMQDGRPIPKVIDFGIAKAVQTPLTEKTLFTRYGQMIGTPVYMSPEQTEFSAVDVDTRSDVYSLGVVFYELLTGKQPFDLQRLLQVGHFEMMRIIREEEPVRPSTRLTRLGKELDTVAQSRHVNPRRLGELVRGDLDWITMKALQKERNRRYDTAAALAEDLVRYLEHRPVRAGPPGLRYRSWKFVQRHRYAVATLVWMLVALMAGLVFAVYGFLSARTERAVAIAAQHTADQQRQLALLEAKRAQSKELRARQISYASDVALTGHALEAGNLGRALSLLNRHAGQREDQDLRGWEWRYLWQQCQSGELFQLAALSNSVLCASSSADGRLLAFGDMDGKVGVWNLPARTLLWASNSTGAIALSRDGKLAADGAGTLRDAESGIVLLNLPGKSNLKRIAFSPDNTLLAALAGEDELCIWEAPGGDLVGCYKGFPCSGIHFGAVLFAPDQSWLAAGSSDGTVRLVEPRTGKALQAWKAHDEGITALAISPDSRLLASASGYSDDNVRLWKPDGSPAGVLRGHRAWIRALSFSPDGRLLASAGADQSIFVWDIQRNEPAARLKGHLHEVWAVSFLSDGKTLVSGGKDGTLKLWSLPEPATVTVKQHFSPPQMKAVTALSAPILFSPEGRELFGIDDSGRVGRWALPSLRPLGRVEALGTNNYFAACAQKSGLVAAVDRRGMLRVWDYYRQALAAEVEICASTNSVTWLEFVPATTQLVVVGDYSRVEVWEAGSWKLQGSWRCTSEDGINQPAISPDGKYVACGGKEVMVYALSNGFPAFRVVAHRPYTDTVAFSPDGRWLATGSQEGLAKLWSVAGWKETATLRGHLLGVHSLAFSADSRRLLTGSLGSESVKVWDLSTMQEVLNLAGPGDLTWRLAFSPDERTLVGMGTLTGIRCWSAPAAAEVRASETQEWP